MITLGGNVCIRNGNELDYCWRESIQSLLPVCDTVTVCDGESTDGTQEEIREWMARDPRIKLCVYPWPNPKGDLDFWVNWLNFCREHITEDYQIQLDADEVLFESSYPFIERFKHQLNSDDQPTALWCSRYNFWRDTKSLIPHGVCCSHTVVRVAPQNVWLPSDGPHPNGAAAIRIAILSPIEIGHYGFLRHPEQFFAKARALQTFFFNNYDERLAAVERQSVMNWMSGIEGVPWIDKLIPFNGKHPHGIRNWLKERGYDS